MVLQPTRSECFMHHLPLPLYHQWTDQTTALLTMPSSSKAPAYPIFQHSLQPTCQRPCNVRRLCWPCQSIQHCQPHPTTMHPWALRSPTKICCCNSNDLHQQHLCTQDRKGNSWDPPECRRTPRWQHGSSPIPLPRDGICRNYWIVWKQQ